MNILASFKNQVELLLDILPFIQHEPCFALKGGTAINLFYRNMPRLSVDIDLTYLPIEPNTVLRGSVFEPEIRELSENAQNIFLQTQKVKTVSMADLYAGKICAALDRQHPRDLFDIKLLFDNEGITPAMQQAFVVYLASSPRPMNELLSPNELDREEIYNKEFIGMTELPISYTVLCETRKRLVKHIRESLLPNEREFLLSIKSGDPEWKLMPIANLSQLPGICWKVMNIQKMDKNLRKAAFDKLKDVLYF